MRLCAFKHHSTGGAEARTRGVAVARAMDEMRARMRDRRLERRARDARDAPPPPPDARGQDPSSAGPSSNHDDVDETATDAYDAALRGLEADRRALREEVLRVRRVDRDREEAARSERARRLELERELARLREDAASAGPGAAAGDPAAAAAAAVDETRAQMRATLAAVDAAARERDETAREIQTELGVLQMERMKLKAVAERSAASSRGGADALVGPSSARETADPKRAASAASAEPLSTVHSGSALETATARLAVEAELRGELEAVAARLAEACAEADETDRAARREMAEMAEAARRAARRAAEAETEALRHGARAEDAEATCATLRERARRAERRLEEAFAHTRNASSKKNQPGEDVSGETSPATPKTEKGAGSSRAELAVLREDLARETSLAKSALREADEANRARDEAARRLAERERELAAAAAAARDAEAASSARLTEAKEAASRESASLRAELSDCQAAFASLRAQLADALADLDGVSREKKSLAEEAARKARDARDAREEAEAAARALAEEREAFRRRWKAAREEAEERESAHRLEKAAWEDTARMARRERYAAASLGGSADLRTGTAAREAEKEAVGAGEGGGKGSGGGDSGDSGSAAVPLAAVPPPSAPGRTLSRHALSNGDGVVAPAEEKREKEEERRNTDRDTSLVDSRVSDESRISLPKATRKRNAFAPNGFPLPETVPAPLSFAPPSDRARAVPVPVPGRSEYDRYLDALPPSPIAGPPPPPPPGRARGRGDAGDEPARRVWRERPTPPP